jgi:hypothetical protein
VAAAGAGSRIGPSTWTAQAERRDDPARVDREVLVSVKAFKAARRDMEINDSFGNQLKPREWFLVRLPVIDEVVERIKDETIVDYEYDLASASLVRRA